MRIKHKREFYIPKGATKIAAKDSTAIAYVYEQQGKLYAIGFHGRAQTPDFHFSYRDNIAREKIIKDHFDAIKGREDYMARTRKERLKPHTLKVGDVLYASWGYEQTNVDFYQVVAVKSEKTVSVRAIKGDWRETGFMSGQCKPRPGDFIEDAPTLVRRSNKWNTVKIDDVRSASPYGDVEREVYWSSYA